MKLPSLVLWALLLEGDDDDSPLLSSGKVGEDEEEEDEDEEGSVVVVVVVVVDVDVDVDVVGDVEESSVESGGGESFLSVTKNPSLVVLVWIL
jgi:hypothetical protein